MKKPEYDIAIIGAGVVGCAIARELSKYKADVLVLEKEEDVSCGASKANSGIVHGGYAAKHGTIKGVLNVKGNRLFESLNKELNFGYRKTGALVLGFNEKDLISIRNLYENGIKNGIDNLNVISKDEILKIDSNINKDVTHALQCKDVGVTSPYEMTIALAENAIINGVHLHLNTEVISINKINNGFSINTRNGSFTAGRIINAAGVYSDKIAEMLGLHTFLIIPRKGQYVIFDRDTGDIVNNVIFQTPSKKGKGILVTSTFWGNLMIGPNAEEVDDKDDVSTDAEILNHIVEQAKVSVPNIDMKKAIRSFSGIRATPNTGDFIIGESPVKGFFNAAGIESPGLTSSPAIAELMVDQLIQSGMKLSRNKDFNPYREAITEKKEYLGRAEAEHLISLDPSPERIVCRCEQVRESVITDSLNRNIFIDSTDSVKRRTRAGMGRCQGSFCRPRVKEIISRVNKIPLSDIKLPKEGSGILPKQTDKDI